MTMASPTQHVLLLPPHGYCYGVEAGPSIHGQIELHGGWKTFDEADGYRGRLLQLYDDYEYAKVVKIETPEASE